MKRQALDHTKMDLLMEYLKIRRYEAVGILESLWHLTAREAPRGDIGKLSDERIAIGIDWRGAANRTRAEEAKRLVDALVKSGWLDRGASEHNTDASLDNRSTSLDNRDASLNNTRLVVHDWQEHADDAVKKYMKRNNLQWACPDMSRHGETNPDTSRLPVPVPEPVPVPAPAPIPIRASPSPSEEIGAAAERMYALHPKKADLPLVPDAVERAVKTGVPLSEIEECHAAWCESEDWQKQGGRFAPKLPTWLFDRGYTRWPPGHHRGQPAVSGPRVQYFDLTKITGERTV